MADCLFCRIVKKEIPAKVVYEDDKLLAFNDIEPVAPLHVLIVPKRHITSMNELEKSDRELVGDMYLVAKKIAKDNGFSEKGFSTVVNAGPQAVPHLHLHVVAGKKMILPG
jgi:histidine triad (HIT) family protein